MIIENSEKIFTELKTSLKRERNFIESNQREDFLDKILEQVAHIDIYYIFSKKALNSIKFFGEEAVIIWDINYWRNFESYMMQVENCRRYHKNMIQGIIGVITSFLSEKYSNIPKISEFLSQIPDTYGIPLQSPKEYIKKVNHIVYIGKLFSLFHEIGHLEHYKKESNDIKMCQEMVFNFLKPLKKEDFCTMKEWADLGWKSVCSIKERRNEEILEEVTSDVFAIMQVINYLKASGNQDNFQLACDCVIAVEYLTTFQNMFNAVNQAWDAHYTEMKYNVPIRKQSAETYINELAMSRDGICSLILVVIVQNMLRLDNESRKILWEYRDENHINNDEVIACLADDEFICTAIAEALDIHSDGKAVKL